MRRSLIAALLIAASPAAADWRAARWGAAPRDARVMAGAAQDIAPGPAYGGGLTARLQGRETVGGLAFRALWQFDDDGLRQVMMERRGPDAGPADAARLIDALVAMFGPPDMRCAAPPAGGHPGMAELIWRLHARGGDGGVLHAVWFDFSTAEAFARSVGDLLRPFPELPPLGAPPPSAQAAEADRKARRALRGQSPDYAMGGLRASKAPRRLLLRWRDPAAARLGSRRCG